MKMAILSGSAIEERLLNPTLSERLVITPLLEASQIREVSVDLRLGNWFLAQTQSQVPSINPGKEEDVSQRRLMYEETFVPYGNFFILHPDQFVLGSTLEYLGLPLDLYGSIEGRSSWGRLGLIIATATGINPGYRGVVTLELRNIGEVPIHLWPGWGVAQIFFQNIYPPLKPPPAGRYSGSIKPVPSTLRPDNDISKLVRIGSFGKNLS